MAISEMSVYVVLMAAVVLGVDFLFFGDQFWERMTVNLGIVLLMVAVILGVDFLFFRDRFWERLTVNIGIVLCSRRFTCGS